jgi:hypothetical protein
VKKRFLLLAMTPLVAASCQPISIADQAVLSAPIHDFDNRRVTRSYECSLGSQIETGRGSSTNVSGGCSACH